MIDSYLINVLNFSSFGNFITAIGAGKSKKEAKHSAAKALIDKLTGVSYTVNEITTTVNGNIE